MTIQHSALKTRFLYMTIIGMTMLGTTARADWVSPAFYSDELDRCTTELRSELNTTGAALLRHTVTDIDKVGVWYVFDIRTQVVDAAGTVIGQAQTRCKAHRWNERAVVDVQNQSLAGAVRVAAAD